jgi:hypothetical protein
MAFFCNEPVLESQHVQAACKLPRSIDRPLGAYCHDLNEKHAYQDSV